MSLKSATYLNTDFYEILRHRRADQALKRPQLRSDLGVRVAALGRQALGVGGQQSQAPCVASPAGKGVYFLPGGKGACVSVSHLLSGL